MRTARIEYVPEASREVEDAIEWYLERSLSSTEAFLLELDRALVAIAEAPGVWPIFEAGTRRYVLRGFPYSLVYREKEGRIEVIAVAHHKRRPRYWRSRLHD